ncbi:MAG: hypothetical protein JXR97_10205 [Planctomycetes bacterium]|nr:hypothetical protein [Planctomycetota bacterium]
MADTRFISFDEAMQILSVAEDELHDLVAANELRAFRVDREMKFKEGDVRDLASGVKASSGDSGVLSIDDADVVMVDADEDIVLADDAADFEMEDVELVDADEGVPELDDMVVADDGDVTVSMDSGELEVASIEEDSGGTMVIEDDGFELEGASDHTQPIVEDGATQVALSSTGGSTEPVLESPGTDGLGTEEIIFEDEDLAIGSLDDDMVGTQEVTVQEAAVGASDLTIRDDTGVSAAVMEDDVEATGASRRVSARRSGRSSVRRTLQVTRAKGDGLWAGILGVTALAMLYPMMLYVNIAWHGYTVGSDTLPSGYDSNEITVREMGPLFVHKFFRGFVDYEVSGAKPAAWWGMPPRQSSTPVVSAPVADDTTAPTENAVAVDPAAPADAATVEGAPAEGENNNEQQ